MLKHNFKVGGQLAHALNIPKLSNSKGRSEKVPGVDQASHQTVWHDVLSNSHFSAFYQWRKRPKREKCPCTTSFQNRGYVDQIPCRTVSLQYSSMVFLPNLYIILLD